MSSTCRHRMGRYREYELASSTSRGTGLGAVSEFGRSELLFTEIFKHWRWARGIAVTEARTACAGY